MENKICVYAISKNEIKFVDRWFNSVKEADYVCVLDTGSTDGTFERLKELGAIAEQKLYENFRFDVARNDSLALIPADADICVCVDIDEFFEPGWAKILKQNWQQGVGRVRYRYTWNFNPDGSEGVVFFLDKIHKKDAYIWKYPVHEVLTPATSENLRFLDLPEIQLNHKADNTKSRKNYLPLLELSVKENPQDDRNTHYLGREYMFAGEYDKAIEMLTRHLNLPSSNWDVERSASLRYIANCFGKKGETQKQEEHLIKAVLECNDVREPYFELGVFYFDMGNYLKSAYAFAEMLKIANRNLNYMSSPVCWGSLPYDYLSICYYEMGEFKKAIITIETAIKLNPEDERLKQNRQIFIEKFNEMNKN